MNGFSSKIAHSIKMIVLRVTGYHENQAAIASGQMQVQKRLDSLAEQVEQITSVLKTGQFHAEALQPKIDTLQLSQDHIRDLIAALHSKEDTLQLSQDSIRNLIAALHPKGDTLQHSQDHTRDLIAALHSKGDMLQLSQDHIRHRIAAFQDNMGTAFVAQLTDEINRLDGYLMYHAASLRDKLHEGIRALRIDIAGSAVLYAAQEMDAIVTVGSYDLVVPTREAGLLSYLKRHGFGMIEPAVRATLQRHLRKGDVAVDAGANIGLHSIVMAQAVGPKGRLIAFEPLPHLAAAMSRSLMLNGLSAWSEVVQAALADGPGDVVIHAAAHSPISSIYALDGVATTPINVPQTSLDVYIPPGGRVDLIKMDIEGAEALAWVGMARVVQENPGLKIIVEWSASHFAKSGHSPAELLEATRTAGFLPWLLRDDAPDSHFAFDPAQAPFLEEGNLLLTRSD